MVEFFETSHGTRSSSSTLVFYIVIWLYKQKITILSLYIRSTFFINVIYNYDIFTVLIRHCKGHITSIKKFCSKFKFWNIIVLDETNGNFISIFCYYNCLEYYNRLICLYKEKIKYSSITIDQLVL